MHLPPDSEEPAAGQPPIPEDWRPVPANLGAPAAIVLSGRRVERWALVLAARAIPFHAERRGFGWQLRVPPERFEAALREIRLFEAENRHWPPPLPPAAPMAENISTTLTVLVALAGFHQFTLLQPGPFGHYFMDWINLGNAHAASILDGHWWRALTALTLHSGWPHLLSNLVAGGIFITRLCRDLGSGLAWLLVLAAGTLGNLVNAFLQHPAHRAVGASTAVFGAVGLLAAMSLVRYRRPLHRRRFLPLAAALALLAMIGAEGERTDLGAHLFGFACGGLLGLAVEFLVGTYGRPGRKLDILLALVAAGTVAGAWSAALLFGGGG